MYTVGLYTLGCKVSLYETEAVAEKFRSIGFEVKPFDEICDVYVINTCTVTAESDAKSRKYIRRAARKNPEAVVCVMGCFSQNSPEEVEKIEGVSLILGTADKMSAPERALEILKNRKRQISVTSLEDAKFEPMRISAAERTRAYVKIEDGCDCKCSYCAISKARGPVRSKARIDVIEEVEHLFEIGTKEVVLTGIETGSYGADFSEKYSLADLICELDESRKSPRIRLGSMAPELVTEDFVKRVSRTKIMTPHIHLSVQSASSAVLRGMKRRYNSEMLYRTVENIRKYMPGAMITADLMVGFPGETEENFRETFDFVSRAGLLDAHVFAYSKRAGTPAADYPGQIPESEKGRRSALLIAEAARVRDLVLLDVVSKKYPLDVIFETEKNGVYTGHSGSYIEVITESETDIRGELVSVIPMSVKNGKICGKRKYNN